MANDEEGKRKSDKVNAITKNERSKAKDSVTDIERGDKMSAEEKTSREVLPVAPGRVKVEIPSELKAALVDDYDLMVKRKERSLLIMPCPSESTVSGVFSRYLAWCAGGEAPSMPLPSGRGGPPPSKGGKAKATPGPAPSVAGESTAAIQQGLKRPRDSSLPVHARSPEEVRAIKEFMDSLLNFFDRKMAVGCLYRFETIQYLAWCREPGLSGIGGVDADETLKVPPHAHSRYWPVETFLRLLSLLPDAFSSEHRYSPGDAEFINSTLGDFLKWLAKYKAALFSLEHYRKASAVYVEEFEKVTSKRGKLPKLTLGECYR